MSLFSLALIHTHPTAAEACPVEQYRTEAELVSKYQREKREKSQGKEKLWREKSIKNETRDGHLISNQCSILGYFSYFQAT